VILKYYGLNSVGQELFNPFKGILSKICKDEKVLFIRSYKRFFYSNGIIKRDLFAIRDGRLYLNEPGLFQFKLALIHVISHW
jgi:hypothetical protein